MKRIRSVIQQTHLIARLGIVAVLVCVGSGVTVSMVQAEWIEPSLPPPQQVFPELLTIGGEHQAKSGYLQLDPDYNPNEDTSLHFDPRRPLDIHGTGLWVGSPHMYIDELRVDTDTLYVSSANDWVGVGTTTQTPGYQLLVDEGTLRAGTVSAPILGPAIRATSTDAVGLYGDAGSAGRAGIYGIYSGTGGWAVRGEASTQVGVRGESAAGTGIYATTQSSTNAAVYAENTNNGWAAYFDGRAGTTGELIVQRFLATYPQTSLIPFAQPRIVSNIQVSDGDIGALFKPSLAFDGQYVWVANQSEDNAGNNVYKIRSIDRQIVASYHVQGVDATVVDMQFDGRYLWFVSSGAGDNSILKFDPIAGKLVSVCSSLDPDADAYNWGAEPRQLAVTTEQGEVFVWSVNAQGGDVTKFDRECEQIGVYPLGTTGVDNYLSRLDDNGWDIQPSGLIYANDALWTVTSSRCVSPGSPPTTFGSCYAGGSCSGGMSCQLMTENLLRINPADGSVTDRIVTGLEAPGSFLFDGVYMWVVSTVASEEHLLSKVRISDGHIMEGYPKDLGSASLSLTFDGTYLWVVQDSQLVRVNVATDESAAFINGLQTNDGDNAILFDGQYVWVLAACTSAGDCGSGVNRPLRLSKVMVNKESVNIDLGTVVQLRNNSGECSVTDTQQCLYDWQCPGGETCSVGNDIQAGHAHIDGSADIRHGYCQAAGQVYYGRPCTTDAACSDLGGGLCRGGDIIVDGDVESLGNVWGGTDETAVFSGGVADCPTDGTFVSGVTIGGSGMIESITCRQL